MLDKTMQRAIVHRPLLKLLGIGETGNNFYYVVLRSEGTWRSSDYVF